MKNYIGNSFSTAKIRYREEIQSFDCQSTDGRQNRITPEALIEQLKTAMAKARKQGYTELRMDSTYSEGDSDNLAYGYITMSGVRWETDKDFRERQVWVHNNLESSRKKDLAIFEGLKHRHENGSLLKAHVLVKEARPD